MAAAENKLISLLREELKAAHGLLEATVGNVTTEEAHWSPPGKASPLVANYAHVVIGEDATVNGMIKGRAPLFAGDWAGKTGFSEPPPGPDPDAPGFPDWSDWGRRVKVDLSAMRKYAEAVYAATDEFLASLTDDDLNLPVDLSALGIGERTLGYLLINGILGNAFTHCGEISCLKGLQGKRGYPG
ncbi:MAG: hypothetical protein GTO13_05695 [Proteobacteria bacterium]|nr:hypothetical protein [Pseudomonadota bacterium]